MSEDVPGYHVLDQIGEGGFSVVYRARQERLDRTVALKVLSVAAVDDAVLRRFQRECKITGRLSGHPNVVTVLDTGTTRAGRPYIAMEFFEHGSLADRLQREGPLPVAEALRAGVKLAGALAATHEIDVLHRDVKPQNILLSRYGEPALADFGIARLVDSFDGGHTQAFTPYHAAPEVLEGRTPDARADVYSLGSTLYQFLAGRPAFQGGAGEGIAQLAVRVLNAPPPPFGRADVPPAVYDVIARAMAKAPEQRYATAVEFALALQRLQGELGLPVTDLAYSGAGAAPVPQPVTPQPAVPQPAASPAAHPAPPPVPGWAPTRESPPQATTGPGPNWPPPGHTGPQPAGPDGPRRGLVIAAAVALLGGAGLGIGALALSGGDGKPPPAPRGQGPATPLASAAPPGAAPEPIAKAQYEAARPRAVTARAVGTVAELRWRLPPAARQLAILVQKKPADGTPVVTAGNGVQTVTVTGLRAGHGYCFRVGALLRVNQGRAADVAWSAPACVNRARARK
ncbi:serine/threonine-protein kinase [Actinomadura macrotermitis]|uniref:non-specific serine/threonine protein kinase n=1 Tax=Actinomadura macrotermitis TaxID=2585200 RepID=A0A7K0C7X9_9ACTN|nr:serine/threonine-protein kinase [Actinomadura macrotermitis]MQY09571.1 Serine/threonine-protein kinase PknD [Actinomadura macrotermitis]